VRRATLTNQATGRLETGPLINLGTHGLLTNLGTLSVGAVGQIASTTVTGTLVQGTTGRLVVDTDHVAGRSDQLTVQGSAQLAGTVEVHPASVSNRAVPVLTATGGLTVDPSLTGTHTYLVNYAVQSDGTTLRIQPQADFRNTGGSLTSTERAVAGHLQEVWDASSDLSGGFSTLARLGDDASYKRALNSLAGSSVGGVVAAKQAASDRFADNLINCDIEASHAPLLDEQSCAWLRVAGGRTTLASDGDNAGYRQDAVTYQMGGQREFAPNWFVGASLGYESSWLESNDDGSLVRGNSALAGVMLKHQMGPWLLTGVVDGNYGWYRSSRAVTVGSYYGQATANPQAGDVGLHLRAAYEMPAGDWYLKPSFTVGTMYRVMSGYSEAGSTLFNLNVQTSNDVIGSFSPKLEVGRGGPVGDFGNLRGFASVGAGFTTGANWTSKARFALAPSGVDAFNATSWQPDAVGKLAVGLDLLSFHGMEAKLTYDADLAPGYTSQTIMGRLAYLF
jgi:outer membrane autotransporter protein